MSATRNQRQAQGERLDELLRKAETTGLTRSEKEQLRAALKKPPPRAQGYV